MLKILLGRDWKKNSDSIMEMLRNDVLAQRNGRILVVPESISHNTERRLCDICGDTASRFAEVLSFTRLLDRVSDMIGSGTCQCMDAGGRIVAMASAAVQLHGQLKAYASVESRPEFLMGLVETLDEFKRSCVSAEDIHLASTKTQGALAQKLEELALLMDAYDAVCAQGKRDPSDQMTWLLEQLEASTFAAEHVFYFDGFTDFTGQQMGIVRHLIENAPLVVVALNCDSISAYDPAFQKAAQTASALHRFAKQSGVACEIENIAADHQWQMQLGGSLFHGTIAHDQQIEKHLRVCQCDSLAEECDYVADRIMELIHSGCRYRDVRVVCTDMGTYRTAINFAFARRGIPTYISGTEEILDMPIINTVLTALDVACSGFEQQNMLRYLRSALSPVDMNTCDLLENYSVVWNVSGARWKQEWVNHPDGLSGNMDQAAVQRLNVLNAARLSAVNPLVKLSDGFAAATTLRQQIQALYDFLEDISLASRLEQMAADTEENGTDAQILAQLWEILLNALEQLYDVLGSSVWDAEMFVRLLKLLLSQYNVGTIPPVLDSVTVGTVSSSGWQREKFLFVIGAAEGYLPNYGSSAGVLTEGERACVRDLGVPLNGGALDGLQSEFADIYNIFTAADDHVFVTCPSGQTSFVYRRLCTLSGNQERPLDTAGAALSSASEAGALLARHKMLDAAASLNIADDCLLFMNRASHSLGNVSDQNIADLYGKKLKLSASQVDKLADCRLAYFLKYGMRANERKEATVDPAEFGTYVHAVLENSAREIKELGGFRAVSLEQTLEIANRHSHAYAMERFSQLDSQRVQYLFNRNADELRMIVVELWEELQDSDFAPAFFELSFGDGAQLPAIQIPDTEIPAELRGFVDRVDLWAEGNQNYFRVVDYKTGKKDFDYCDVFNGLGLQMLLYMFALEDNGEAFVGKHPVSAGVQYFPARAPVISAESSVTEEEAKQARLKQWKRKGLVLNDEQVLHAMENADEPVRTGYTRKKDGSVSGDVADRQQMRMLKAYVFALLKKLVDDIASGCVQANPYTRGSSHNACAFCPYGAICHPSELEERRDYKAMTASYFWDQVAKEVGNNG